MSSRITTTFLLILTTCLMAEEPPCGHACKPATLNAVQRLVSDEQLKIDALYYRIDVHLKPDSNMTDGTYLARFQVVDTTLTQLELNFDTMTQRHILSLIVNGDSVDYTHTNDLLVIPVADSLQIGDTLEVVTHVRTGPLPDSDDRGFNWDTQYGERLIYTNSQPYDAREWWPSKDYPSDKPDSMDMIIRVPEAMVVASNGRLQSVVEHGDGTRTWHWHEGYPIATYLVSLSIYPFFQWSDTYVDANGDSLPILYFTFRDTLTETPDYLVENYRKTPDMIEAFVERFGPYPFMGEKYGHAEWGESYGMEHQTLTSMGDPTERRVAHELAHMWWGDMITCDSYHHIWLNEGFARYAEALWWEASRGALGYREKMMSHAYYGGGTVYVEDPENENIFDFQLSYNKASWVLHMLRHVVGDSTFFEILHTYGEDPEVKHASATTAQFQAICEAVSGHDLNSFFQQWIYGQYYPIYRIGYTQLIDTVLIEVAQQGMDFDMPVDLVVVTPDTALWTTLRITEGYERFYIPLPAGQMVTAISLDPYNWVLKDVEYVVNVQEVPAEPAEFALTGIYPNPFNEQVRIDYHLPQPAAVRVTIHDLAGRQVWSRDHALLPAGEQHLTWPARDQLGRALPTGIYLLRISIGMEQIGGKLILMR